MFLSAASFVVTAAAQTVEPEEFFSSKVLSGKICFVNGQVNVDTLPWNPHAKFKGVSMKNLLTGKDTGGRLSCHIVRVEPGCVLDTHAHAGKLEIHEVIGGKGTLLLDGREFEYTEGAMGVIPDGTPHKVVAGEEGLCLLAKFTPALE